MPATGISQPGDPLYKQHPESLSTTLKVASTQQKKIELCFGMVGLLFRNFLRFRDLEFASI